MIIQFLHSLSVDDPVKFRSQQCELIRHIVTFIRSHTLVYIIP